MKYEELEYDKGCEDERHSSLVFPVIGTLTPTDMVNSPLERS